MRKLSTKITMLVVICFLAIISLITWFAVSQSQSVVKEAAERELKSIAIINGKDIMSKITEVETIGTNLESIIVSTLDVEKAKTDPAYMDAYEAEMSSVFSSAIKSAEGKSGWIVFDSKNLPGGHVLSFTNNDGTMKREAEYDVYEGGYDKDDWWAKAVQNGYNWSDPYFWEAWDATIVSYSRKIEKDGVLLGIGGSDFFFDSLRDDLAKIKIYDTGYLALMNSNFDFIYHPDETFTNLTEVEGGALKSVADQIGSSAEDIGIIYYELNGEKKLLSFNKLENGWIVVAAPTYKEVFAEVTRLRNTMMVMAVAGIFIAIAVSFVLGKSIGNKIVLFGKQFEVGANGDLTSQITINSKDEIGDMGTSYNQFIFKLSQVIEEIKEVIGKAEAEYTMLNMSMDNFARGKESKYYSKVHDAVDNGILQLQYSIENVIDHVSTQASSTEESLAGLEEILASNNGVSENAREALDVSKQSYTLVKQSVTNVSDMSKNMGEVSASVSKTNIQIDRLTNLSSDIGGITTTINSLSEQTNLLALNAAIEAARAGEAGRGFSVVADEIRKLAELTNKETEKIEKIVNNIQEEISVVKNSNTEVIKHVETGTKLTDIVSEDIKSIIDITKKATDAMAHIATASAEQTKATEEITKAVGTIAESSVEIEQIGKNTLTLSGDLTQSLIDKLESLEELNVLISKLRKDIAFFKSN